MEPENRWRHVVRPRVEREVSEEIAFHLEMRVRELMAGGMSEAEARRQAEALFGDVNAIDAECMREGRSRDTRFRLSQMSQDFASDVRFALRSLRKAPGFTATAVLMIAIGIASTTSIFSAVNGVLLHPLSYPGATRLVVPETEERTTGDTWSVSYADFQDWERTRVFEHVAVYSTRGVNLTGDEGASWAQSARVTPDFFATLGVRPVLGRLFAESDHVPGASPPSVVVSHAFWKRELGGRRDVIGSTVRIAGLSSPVIGVLAEDGDFPRGTDVWFPHRVAAEDRAVLERRDNFVYQAIARLPAGKTIETARAELRSMAASVEQSNPVARKNVSITATPLDEWLVGANMSRTLWLFLGAVGLVLVIACVNIANLILSRGSTRAREIAVRKALGAGKVRVLRQLLTESLVLALCGGVLGVALAFAAVRGIVLSAPPGTPRLDDIEVSGAVLLFALVATLLSALLFGLYPALRSSRGSEAGALSEGSLRTTASRRARRGRNLLVVSELALSLVLITAAGLLLRSFSRLQATDTGLETEHVVAFSLALQGPQYGEGPARAAAYRRIHEVLQQVPGVSSVAATSALPLGGGGLYLGRAFLREGQPDPPASTELVAHWNIVTPAFFETAGIPLIRGRAFGDGDSENGTLVAIINRRFADEMFHGEDPIGRRVRSWRDENEYREVVGVVENMRYYAAGDSLRPLMYVPHAQDSWGAMSMVLRTKGAASGRLEQQLRDAIRTVDAGVAVADFKSMDRILSESLGPQRFAMLLLSGFAAIALALALIGVYGVLSYAVDRRRPEIAVRMALGAQTNQVWLLILREAGVVIGTGIVIGLAVAFLVTRLMTSLLYEVDAADPLTFAGAAVVIGVVAAAASAIPARRASLVQPMHVMRTE